MSGSNEINMNLKLNNDVRDSGKPPKLPLSSIKEERRRTGRYIAILVGISLLLLAIYHAWVRRIPVVASLVVPALIMFIYVGWVLYTASRDKHRLLDAEAALRAAALNASDIDVSASEAMANSIEISVISNKQSSRVNSLTESTDKDWTQISSVLLKGENNIRTEEDSTSKRFIQPIILINDKPPDDVEQRPTLDEVLPINEKLKVLPTKKKFRRKFCRSRRHAAFKRSYSIA